MRFLGINNNGKMISGYEKLASLADFHNINVDRARELVYNTETINGITYTVSDEYEEEFRAEYQAIKDWEMSGEPGINYVDQDRYRKEDILKNFESELKGTDGGVYSYNGSSAHYKDAVLEYVDKQERCYGTFVAWCLCFQQVDKYRDRAGKKEGVPAEKDLIKSDWYGTAAFYLKEKIILNNSCDTFNFHKKMEFDKRYGYDRSTYINMPFQLSSLVQKEFKNTDRTIKTKTLGEIVDENQ